MSKNTLILPDVMAANCPSRSLMKHVTSKWGVLVLLALSDGTARFSDLRRRIEGVSERMLAQTLKNLEDDGFVNRKSYNVVPPHVEYSLTPFGDGVVVHISALAGFLENSITEDHG